MYSSSEAFGLCHNFLYYWTKGNNIKAGKTPIAKRVTEENFQQLDFFSILFLQFEYICLGLLPFICVSLLVCGLVSPFLYLVFSFSLRCGYIFTFTFTNCISISSSFQLRFTPFVRQTSPNSVGVTQFPFFSLLKQKKQIEQFYTRLEIRILFSLSIFSSSVCQFRCSCYVILVGSRVIWSTILVKSLTFRATFLQTYVVNNTVPQRKVGNTTFQSNVRKNVKVTYKYFELCAMTLSYFRTINMYSYIELRLKGHICRLIPGTGKLTYFPLR